MANLTQHHVITRLLRDGIIEGDRNQALFDTLLDHRPEVEAHLSYIGMELVLLTDARIAHARNMTDERLDGLADSLKAEPISRVCTHKRLTYYDSIAAVFFRKSLDQEARQGGDEIWISHDEVVEALSRAYSASVSEDRVAMDGRITSTLKRLDELKLIGIRTMGKASRYRGKPLLQVAFSQDAISDFARQLDMLADGAEAGPEGADLAPAGETEAA